MKIRPLRDRVLLKMDPKRTETKGCLAIPEGPQQWPMTGEVVAIGLDVAARGVAVGDRVSLFGRLPGETGRINELGIDLAIVWAKDLVAHVDPAVEVTPC